MRFDGEKNPIVSIIWYDGDGCSGGGSGGKWVLGVDGGSVGGLVVLVGACWWQWGLGGDGGSVGGLVVWWGPGGGGSLVVVVDALW